MPTLTDEQRRQWAVDGYIHLKGALDAQTFRFTAD